MDSLQPGETLSTALSGARGPHHVAAARAVLALAQAASELAAVISRPSLSGGLGTVTGGANSDGDAQRQLDLIAEDICREALMTAQVGPYLSEETEAPITLDESGEIAVAIDPLDGSSNIDVNGVVGTIFSLLPAPRGHPDPALAFMQSGRAQIGAGFFMYGPQTSLVVSLGSGVDLFILDRRTGEFVLSEHGLAIPRTTSEFAINASNHRHWQAPVRAYIEDCLAGETGPRGRNFNMRWAASLVADAFRIFARGGVFLYPGDARKGYERGRLRLLYEASPIAFLAEQAGGAASDGERPILDLIAERPHQRAPLVMGSVEEVDMVRRGHALIDAAAGSRP